MKVFFDLMWFFKQEKKSYLSGIVLLVIVSLLQLIPPKIIGMVVDQIGSDSLTKEITASMDGSINHRSTGHVSVALFLADYDLWFRC